jgi:hypothetical protein
VLARSAGRQAKETAMRRKRLARLLRKLRVMRRSLPSRDQLLVRIGVAKKEAGRAFGFVKIHVPLASEPVTRQTFHFEVDKSKLTKAQQRDGHYLLRSNLTAEDPAVLWTRYVQLTQIEAVFRSLKSELGIRPIYHRLESRVDAHILIAFLAYRRNPPAPHRVTYIHQLPDGIGFALLILDQLDSQLLLHPPPIQGIFDRLAEKKVLKFEQKYRVPKVQHSIDLTIGHAIGRGRVKAEVRQKWRGYKG